MLLINHLVQNRELYGVYVKAAVASMSKSCPMATRHDK